MSDEDRSRWEQRYKERSHASYADPWIVRQLEGMERGTLLDVAAGEGALSLEAAALGFAVTALDIAPTALLRLENSAREKGASTEARIRTRIADLDEEKALSDLGLFDCVVISKYKPSPSQWNSLISAMRPGATLLLCSFSQKQLTMRPAFRLNRLELEEQISLRLCLWEDIERGGDHLSGSLWRSSKVIPE